MHDPHNNTPDARAIRGPSRRTFLAMGATPVLGALVPTAAKAAMGRPEARLGYLRGSDTWSEDDPRRQNLMRGHLPDPALLTPTTRATNNAPASVRISVRPLRDLQAGLRQLDTASMDLVALPHRVPFRVFDYQRSTLDPMTLPSQFTAPVDPEHGFVLHVRSRWRGDRDDAVTTLQLGPGGTALRSGAYVLSVQAPNELLALALWIEA